MQEMDNISCPFDAHATTPWIFHPPAPHPVRICCVGGVLRLARSDKADRHRVLSALYPVGTGLAQLHSYMERTRWVLARRAAEIASTSAVKGVAKLSLPHLKAH